MAKNKGVGPAQSAAGSQGGDVSSLENELQSHKEHTAAQISDLQTTLNVYQESINAFRLEMMAEFRALKEASAARVDPVSSTPLKFGSVELEGFADSATSTRAMVSSTTSSQRGNGSQPLALVAPNSAESESLLQFHTSQPIITNASGVVMNTLTVTKVSEPTPKLDKGKSVSLVKGQASGTKSQGCGFTKYQPNQFFQHSNFGSQPLSQTQFQYSSIPPFGAQQDFVHAQMAMPNTFTSHTQPMPMNFGHPHFQHIPQYPNSFGNQINHQFTPYMPQQLRHTPYDPNLPTMKQMKLEFSSFGGGDPVEWLNKAEQFFEFYQIPEERKLALASMHLIEKASDRWFMFKHEFPHSWAGLTELLMREFGGHRKVDHQAALARMNQVGSVEHYMEEFTKLARRAPVFSPQTLLSFFVGGLKESIRSDVRALKPKTLYEACELAKIYEEKEINTKAQHRTQLQPRAPIPPPRPTYNNNNGTHQRALQPARVPAPQGVNAGGNSRRLTQAEYQERRARNQCFFCDELFRPGHNCRRGQALMVIEVVQEEVELQGPKNEEEVDNDRTELNVAQEVELQLHALGDESNNQTMQLKGECLHHQVHVLVDSGASHNFIHPSVVKKAKAIVQSIKPVKVRLASGYIMETKGKVQITIKLQQYELTTQYYVLPISGCEVILGASWLKSLGDIVWNFEKMYMKFYHQDVQYTLLGETELHSSIVSCKSMTRLLRREREAMLIQLQSVPANLSLPKTSVVDPQISNVLQKYSSVFDLSCSTVAIIQLLQQGREKKHYKLVNSILYYKDRIFVPPIDGWRNKIISEFHGGKIGGHAGRARTYKRVVRSFRWPGVQKSVKEFVAYCDVCQQQHYETVMPPGLLQPISIPPQAWHTISMDFVEALPKSDGKSVIWVVIDKLTKYAHFIPLAHPYTAATLAQIFVKEIFKLHGMPDNIISDRDPIFMSLFWEASFALQGTQLSKPSAYHPQSDGQTENLNRTLEQYLRCVVGEKPQDWVKCLAWAEWWYNSAYHTAIAMSPFEALYRYPPPPVIPYIPGSTAIAQADEQLRKREELLTLLKRNLQRAQARMKHFHDKRHTERSFEVGDMVYLKLQPYKQHSMQRGVFNKLSARYYGPFEVLEKIGSVAYKLKLPPTVRIHNVFHVSLLKKKLGDQTPVLADLPPIIDPANPKWEPAAVFGRRMVKKAGAAATQWLVHWIGTTPEEATWEFAEETQRRFPEFDPET